MSGKSWIENCDVSICQVQCNLIYHKSNSSYKMPSKYLSTFSKDLSNNIVLHTWQQFADWFHTFWFKNIIFEIFKLKFYPPSLSIHIFYYSNIFSKSKFNLQMSYVQSKNNLLRAVEVSSQYFCSLTNHQEYSTKHHTVFLLVYFLKYSRHENFHILITKVLR